MTLAVRTLLQALTLCFFALMSFVNQLLFQVFRDSESWGPLFGSFHCWMAFIKKKKIPWIETQLACM